QNCLLYLSPVLYKPLFWRQRREFHRQRALAAFLAISLRSSAVSFSARARAHACPLRTFPDGSFKGSASSPTNNPGTVIGDPMTSAGLFSPRGISHSSFRFRHILRRIHSSP